jgi:hypothetical protein
MADNRDHLTIDQICCKSRQPISVTVRKAEFDIDIPAFDKTSVNKALAECVYKVCGISR